jgi:hypothetical protein
MNRGRKINPNLMRNVKKYIAWMPEKLNSEITYEIVTKSQEGREFEPVSLQESLAFLIAAMARKPTAADRGITTVHQTEWVRRIIKDLGISQKVDFHQLGRELSLREANVNHFIVLDKNWQEYNYGWEGGMWSSLLSGIGEYEESDFLEMERNGWDYGNVMKSLIFSERLSNFKFINWLSVNPFEVKQ